MFHVLKKLNIFPNLCFLGFWAIMENKKIKSPSELSFRNVGWHIIKKYSFKNFKVEVSTDWGFN